MMNTKSAAPANGGADGEAFSESLTAALARRDASPVAPLTSAELAELAAAQRSLGGERFADDASLKDSLSALGEADTLAVVTGQQAGLLGGPLYAFAKAAAAVATARKLQVDLGRRVVPVFWIASDDHDFEEIRTARWLGKDGSGAAFQLESPAASASGGDPAKNRVPAFGLTISQEERGRLIAQIEESTHETEFRVEVLGWLRNELVADDIDLATHMGRWAGRLFAGTGLVLVAPHLGFLRKRGTAQVLRREIEAAGASSRAVISAGEAITDAGGTPQLHRTEDAVNFFLMTKSSAGGTDRCRVRFVAADNHFEVEVASDNWERMSREEMLALADTEPERFSPNVVTRPVVQDAALPTIAYIGGPGERAYFRQLGGVYEHFGIAMPWIAARPEIVLLEPRVRRSFDRLQQKPRELLPRLCDQGADDTLVASFDRGPSLLFEMDRLSVSLSNRVESIARTLPAQFSRSKGGLDKMRDQIDKSLDRLRTAIHADAEQTQRELTGHLDKIRASLRPDGAPQERVYNLVVPFLVNYGFGMAERLIAAFPAASDEAEWWLANLPLDEGAELERLGGIDSDVALWIGADI